MVFNFVPCFFKKLILVILLVLYSCSSVPKEVVELSYKIGQDLESVHFSYTQLISDHFNSIREDTEKFLNTKWNPNYIKDFIKSGELIESAQGSNPTEVLEDVQLWAEVAVEEIQDKKNEMLEPINNQEKELMESVNQAFANLIRANATITAHLNSLRKVKEAQKEVLEALKLRELQKKINQKLVSASETAERAIKDLEKAEDLVDRADKAKKKLKKKFKGENK